MQFIFFDSFIFNCISLLFAFPKRCIGANGCHECMDRAGSPCFPWVSVGWWIRIGRKYRVSTMCWSLRVEDGWQFKSWILGLASVSPALSQVSVLKVHKIMLEDYNHCSQDEGDAARDPGVLSDHPHDGLQSHCSQLRHHLLWQEDGRGHPVPYQEVIIVS